MIYRARQVSTKSCEDYKGQCPIVCVGYDSERMHKKIIRCGSGTYGLGLNCILDLVEESLTGDPDQAKNYLEEARYWYENSMEKHRHFWQAAKARMESLETRMGQGPFQA
ncbi:hypothetical protein HYU11_03965 [Candidatus Woesearchaeota archaeon]|nr:hypothetical protein [Candidatus Woesearchaeota archaeon]